MYTGSRHLHVFRLLDFVHYKFLCRVFRMCCSPTGVLYFWCVHGWSLPCPVSPGLLLAWGNVIYFVYMSSAAWLNFCMHFFSWWQRMHLVLQHTEEALLFHLPWKLLSLERGIHTDPWSISEAALLRPQEGGSEWRVCCRTELLCVVWLLPLAACRSVSLLVVLEIWGSTDLMVFSFLHLVSSVSFFICKHIVIIKYIVPTWLVQTWICFCSITEGSPRAHISSYL